LTQVEVDALLARTSRVGSLVLPERHLVPHPRRGDAPSR
jgi:hypothetical protein